MKKLAVNELSGTAYFSEPVYLDSGYILSSPDVPITKELRNRLVEWNFRALFTEGEIASEAPEVTGTADTEPGDITQSYEEEQDKKQAVDFFRNTVDFLEAVFARFKEKEELRLVELTEKVKEIAVEVKANRGYMLSLDDSVSPAKTYITTHSVKTTILALAVADYMKMAPYKQIDVGLAGLLHELGLMKIPETLYLSDRPLSPQEKQTIAAHPVIGFRILKGIGFPDAACLAVLEHNERVDGSGFPRRLKGDKISLPGKILAVSSSYNAIVSNRPYKVGIDGHAGIMDILKDAGNRYDEKVLAALVYVLSLYPIGTYLRMSNGSIGLVVKANEEDPKHPQIKLVIDENGNRYSQQPIVQTRAEDDITIGSSLSKEELLEITAGK